MSRTGSSCRNTCVLLAMVALLAPAAAYASDGQQTFYAALAEQQNADLQEPSDRQQTPVIDPVTPPPPGSPPSRGLMIPLYGSLVALQAMDVHSTLRAIDRGGYEANSLMRSLSTRPVSFSLVKGASAAATIYLVEKMGNRNRTAAVLTMVGLNAVMAFVVVHNYRVGNH